LDPVVVIAGATASGKTQLALALALEHGAEIVGADSRQIYRDMPIGTAAPTPAQRAAVPHHLVDFLDPRERYSAARFSDDATRVIEQIRQRGKRVIVVGGTGFYTRALTGSVDLAQQADAAIRERLARESRMHDAHFLHAWLHARDPRRAAMLHESDAYRVMRALEVALSVRERDVPVRSLASRHIPFRKYFLSVDFSELETHIARRTDAMLSGGLLEEAERMGIEAVAASAVGYPQALAFLRGWSTRDELRASLVRATRRYAKRQFTWFRSEPATTWLSERELMRAARETFGGV